MQKLNDWWFSLQPRERWLISGGAVLLAVVALYTFALAPFYAAVDAQAERIARKETDLAWLRSAVPQVQALAARQLAVVVPGDESLVVLVDRTARESGLSTALTGQTPAGQSAIRVRLESAAFDAMLQWLGTLQQAHAVGVESATIDRTAKPGLVDASLVLNRAGG